MKTTLRLVASAAFVVWNVMQLGAASTIEFAVTDYSATEGDWVGLRLTITPPVTTSNAQVRLVQTGGSAGPLDFTFESPGATISVSTAQTLTWANIGLTDDGLVESNETIEFVLMNPTGGLALGAKNRAVVTIQNAAPSVGLSPGSQANETSAYADIPLYRGGDLNVTFTVDFATIANGTAVPGVNFIPTNGTLTVPAGERSISFRLPILDDGVVAMDSGPITFGVYLTNASAGVRINPEPVQIRIRDSQWPTTLDLSYVSPLRGRLSWAAVAANGQMIGCEQDRGSNGYRFVRLNPDGSLAARSSPVVFEPCCEYRHFSLQPDGKILVAGDFASINGVQLAQTNFARLNADGSLDKGFQPAVIPSLEFAGADITKPLTDGRMLVFDGTMLRALRANGELDVGFQARKLKWLQALVEDSRGKVLVASDDSSGLTTIVRLNEDGSPDTSFTPVSVGQPTVSARIFRMLPQPDEKLLIAGPFDSVNGVSRTGLARLNPDGTTDMAFDAGLPPDWASFPFTGIRGLAPLDNGKIVIAYSAGWCGTWLLRRCNADGSLDRQFPVHLCADGPRISAMTSQGGRLLVAGDLGSVNGFYSAADSGVVRLLLDEAPESAAVMVDYGLDGFEGTGEAKITVRRLGDVRVAATVLYRTQDRSAQAGRDYTPLAGTLSFAPLEAEQTVTAALLDDQVVEPDEEFEIVLNDPTGQVAVGPPAIIPILDDDPAFRDLERDASGWVYLKFSAPPSERWRVQASSDLIHWSSSGLRYGEIGPVQPGQYWRSWTDADAGNDPSRFYRAVKE